MAISYPLEIPGGLYLESIEWIHETSVGFTESPFSRKLKVYDNGGKRFRVSCALPVMTTTDAKRWLAFFLSLNGLEGTFRLTPSAEKFTEGSAQGTPLVDGASETGQSLSTDGWIASQTRVLAAGDWIELEGFLYRVLNDVASDGSGAATLDLWPNLRATPSDNAPITTSNPKGTFRLAELPNYAIDVNRLVNGLKFEAVEAI